MDRTMAGNYRSRLLRLIGLPRLTPLRAAALLAGAVAVHTLVELPHTGLAIALGTVAALLLFVRGGDRAPVWFVLGFAWTVVRAAAVLQAQLPAELHGRDFQVHGVVRGLPQVVEGSTRFEFDIRHARLEGKDVDLRGRARLSWYAGAPALAPCAQWTFTARLRPPRGLVNPGGHDGERGAALAGRVAVGYVRDARDNRLLAAAGNACVDGWREAIGAKIDAHAGAGGPLLRALAIGDQSRIAESQWQVLRATGTGHLIAISGLHVGLFAAFGVWLARAFWKLFPRLTLRVPAPLIEAPVALACAFGYGLLAGMGTPTQRALLMIGVALLARLARRSGSATQALGLAAVAIVAVDPLAVLAAGFWLSFAGVAILLSVTRPVGDERPAWRDLPRVQVVLGITLLPLTVWFFGQGSLVGPVANLVAVPWISFVVVPLNVAASLLLVPLPALGEPLLHAAESVLWPLWWFLRQAAALPSAQLYFAAAPPWAFVLALIGAGWCLLPRGVPARALGLVLVLPLLMPMRPVLADGEFEVWMFDVGQGLSILVRTREHALLYDAGPRYPGGFDVGEAVVIPSLRALGVNRLDRLMISHGDNDHAGGAPAVKLAFPMAAVSSGEPERTGIAADACAAGEAWVWDGVRLRVLWPAGVQRLPGNDRSCVLAIEGRHGSLLLTGDVSDRVERLIVQETSALARPLTLVVAHHGSRTGSSAEFLDALAADSALVSAGYRNRFNHPHADVVARFDKRSIELIGTAENGYVHLAFTADAPAPSRGRRERTAWWRQP